MSLGKFSIFLWAMFLIFLLLGMTTEGHPSQTIINFLGIMFGGTAIIYTTEWAKEHYGERSIKDTDSTTGARDQNQKGPDLLG